MAPHDAAEVLYREMIQSISHTGFLKGVLRKSLVVLLPAAVLSGFIEWQKLPLGIIMGGLFGILNLRGLIRNVEGFMGAGAAPGKIVFLSMTRLLGLCAAMFILLWFKIVNVLGLLFGFTVVFVCILLEGLKAGKSDGV